MFVQRLELEEFRLYQHLALEMDAKGLCVIGKNATGKSTFVEAIALLATMRSPRTGSDRELIRWGSGQELGVGPYARSLAHVVRADDTIDVEVGLQVDGSGEGPLRKSVKVQGRPVRALDAVGQLKIVLFAPEDVALISGAPSHRRRYLDLFISQIDNRYVRSLARYNRVLEQRNSLLKALGKQSSPSGVANELAFWNDELVTYGSYLVARRMSICFQLAGMVAERFLVFSDAGELTLSYKAGVGTEIPRTTIERADIETIRDLVHRSFESRLNELRHDELRRGVSLAGPHRDDFSVLLNGMEVGTYGSRGQQRLAVVAIKLAEAGLMHAEAGDTPVVMLDDVLSELDAVHRERLLGAVATSGAQLILTATDGHLFDVACLAGIRRCEVRPGAIELE